MNAIVSKVPLISEAPIEGKWYDLGTVTVTSSGTGLKTTSNKFNIPDLSNYIIFAARLIKVPSVLQYSFFGQSSYTYPYFVMRDYFNTNFQFGFPYTPEDPSAVSSVTNYTTDYVTNTQFPGDFYIKYTGIGGVGTETYTVQLLGMK